MLRIALLVILSPLFVWAAEKPTCLFLFDGKPIYQVKKPFQSYFGLEPIEEQAHVIERHHAFGTTFHILSVTALRLREVLKTGEIIQELYVDKDGHVTFTNWAKRYRNVADIPAESAKELMRQLDRGMNEGEQILTLAANQVHKGLEIYLPDLRNQTSESEVWRQSAHQMQPWIQLKFRVGQEYRHAFGLIRLIFDPTAKRVVWLSVAPSGSLVERISLFADGTAKRITNESGLEIISHMDAQIAQGIMAYAYYQTSLGGWNFITAIRKYREFVLSEVPDLFASELPSRREQTLQVSTKDGVVPVVVDNRPEKFDPDLGVNQ